MKTPTMTAAVLALLLLAAPAPAQPPGAPSPTIQHTQMAREAGVWDAQMTMWMAAGAPPITMAAVETNTMLGPYWMISDFRCESEQFPFAGHAQMGYDPTEKKYIGTWVDTMNPHISQMSGGYDSQTHTLTMISKGRDFSTGEMQTSTMVSRFVDDDTKTFTMYAGEPGADGKPADDAWKMMQIEYKRRK